MSFIVPVGIVVGIVLAIAIVLALTGPQKSRPRKLGDGFEQLPPR